MKISSIVMLAASFLLIVVGIVLFANKKRFEGENQAGKYSAKYIQSNAIGNIFIGFLGTILGVLDNFVNGNSIKIALPRLDEQEKIALILSEIDEKIEGYENKKQKLEELKKGLMQQLLTGNIRV